VEGLLPITMISVDWRPEVLDKASFALSRELKSTIRSFDLQIEKQ
jgi:hypothetical protein